MKTLSAGLSAHLATAATTLAYCWRLTRRDGTVLGFTEHDQDVVFDGTTFEAATGFTASQIAQGLGLSVDNLSASGALSSLSITEADIVAGLYDDALLELFWINWADPSQGVIISRGNLGELKRKGLAFTAEFRSLASRLNQPIGSTFQRTCLAKLGDAQCRIDLSLALMHGTCVSQTSGQTHKLIVTGIASFAADWFTDGTIEFTAGANDGLIFEIKSHIRTSGQDVLDLWESPPFPMAVGDSAKVVVGCRKTFNVCKTKFLNVENFRGFPHIPGSDRVTMIATRDMANLTGGSLFAD